MQKDDRNVFYLRKKNLCRNLRWRQNWSDAKFRNHWAIKCEEKFNKRLLKHISQHIVTDIQLFVVKKPCRNPLNFCISYSKQCRVVQNRQNRTKLAKRRKDDAKFLQLRKYFNGLLYIGNCAASQQIDDGSVVINLSLKSCSQMVKQRCHCFEFHFNEQSIDYHSFLRIVKHIHLIVMDCVFLNKKVMIICDKAINK